jgi:hypothetical protein
LLPEALRDALASAVGETYLRLEQEAMVAYGQDGQRRGHPADAVVLPADTTQVAAVVCEVAAAKAKKG